MNASPSPGSVLDLDITNVAHGGVFVGRHEGRVVFTPDAIPGERVRVRITEAGEKSFWKAETLEILDASAHRRPHVWAAADVEEPPEQRPGGADFGHIDLAHQRTLKLQVLGDALQRMAGLTPPLHIQAAGREAPSESESESESADGTGWRTRLSLHVDEAGRIGPFAARSHRVIPVTDHPLATEDVERAGLLLEGGAVGRVDLVQPRDGSVRVIHRPDGAPGAHRRRSGLSGGRAAQRPGTGPRAAREVVVERAGGRDFRVDAGGFWQVHRLAAHTLDAAVRDAVARAGGLDPEGWHLDLYGGVGLFAAALGDVGGPAARITSVEADVRASDHARENLAEWVDALAVPERVDRFVARVGAEASKRDRERLSQGVVVLDPPRSGAGRAVTEGIAALSPAAVVYVACDPVALARDLDTFQHLGYRTDSVGAFDLFPNSHHLEAVALLRRQG